jgi:hypothetical protein
MRVRIVSTSSGTWAKSSIARETEGVGVAVGATGVCVGVGGIGVGVVRAAFCWVLEGEPEDAWLNETAVGDGVAVGGGVDVLVGVGVGDDLLPQPTSVKDKSNSVLDTIAKIKTGSAARDVRRATGVYSVNLSPPEQAFATVYWGMPTDDWAREMCRIASTPCCRGSIPQNRQFVKRTLAASALGAMHVRLAPPSGNPIGSGTARTNLIGFGRGHVV